MSRHDCFVIGVLLSATSLAISSTATAGDGHSKSIVTFGSEFDLGKVRANNAKLQVSRDGETPVLQMNTGHESDWPGVTFPAPSVGWDLSDSTNVASWVKNVGSKTVTVYCRVDSPGGDGLENSVTDHVQLKPGERQELTVELRRQLPPQLVSQLFGMRGYPGGMSINGIDAARVIQVTIFVNKPKHDHQIQLSTIQAQGCYDQGNWVQMSAEDFFPMIDSFGQFVHRQWPGKTTSLQALRQATLDEAEDLAAHPGPLSWTQFGGWKDGPELEATGYFRTIKVQDKWWLVDPEGRLFWSHGVDCVGFANGATPISDREFYFADLPPDNSSFSSFYGRQSWAPHGYYHGKGGYRTFNFTSANLMRKYGDAWYDLAADHAHRRLRSWSLNTIGNWSDAGVYRLRKTPYVVAIGSGGAQPIQGSAGYWGQFPDPFDPSFRQALDRRMDAEQGRTAGDAWCLGYFVDNELSWGDERSLAIAALASPASQSAKKVFVSDLKQSYQTVERLNSVWGTTHESWDALSESRTPPDQQRAARDLEAFYTTLAETYFRHCREAVKRVAPENLYLGCRFAWVNDRGARAAAKYCDVIGYNLYRDSVADFALPDGLDKPVMIGEFHFGALDRGMFHTGLRPTRNQRDRADAYRNYVTGALKNPCLVGTHWFQYGDQATTGRGDGENYQIGLVDICDQPYRETIEAVRTVGDAMYLLRFDSASPTQ